MITCNNITRITDLDFKDYLQLQQYSHSFLKSEKYGYSQFKGASIKMQLGSLVDAIRTNGDVDMGHQLYRSARKIAALLYKELGWAFDKLEKQVSYTGVMRYNAGKAIFEMPVKGRPDFELRNEFILDLKVTNEPKEKIDSLINFMGYTNQQFCYGKLGTCKTAYLLFFTTKTNEVLPLRRIAIGDSNSFWEEKIIKFGKAI